MDLGKPDVSTVPPVQHTHVNRRASVKILGGLPPCSLPQNTMLEIDNPELARPRPRAGLSPPDSKRQPLAILTSSKTMQPSQHNRPLLHTPPDPTHLHLIPQEPTIPTAAGGSPRPHHPLASPNSRRYGVCALSLLPAYERPLAFPRSSTNGLLLTRAFSAGRSAGRRTGWPGLRCGGAAIVWAKSGFNLAHITPLPPAAISGFPSRRELRVSPSLPTPPDNN